MLSYLLFIATVGGIYGLLALSLNLIWGGAGMVNLGLAGFFAVGAYASALLTTAGHAPIAVGWLAALVAGGVAGLVVTLSTTRLREDYLAIVTLGFAEVVRLLAANEIWLTRGSDGISGIPGPWKAALGPAFNAVYFLIVIAALAVVFFVVRRIDRSPYGRALRAIREDAQVAQVAGKPVLRFKTEAFTLSAAIAGLAGALYGHFTSYIAPDLFLPLITVYIFLAVASGGTGRPAGALLGAYLVMTLLESSRFFVEWIPAVTAVQRAALKEPVGHKLFTLLYVTPDGRRVKRLYTNMPKEYPVGGYKPVTESDWHKHVIGQRRPWVGFTYEDVKWAFFDHELIRSLGCESAINVPVVYAGRVLGTMNLLDAAGHYRETDPVRIEPFAALLIGPFLDAIAADPG